LVSEHGIHIHKDIETDATLFADQEKLLRALLNVTFNGIRHAHTQVNIRVTAESGASFITIEDDGEGITEELIPHMFHRFVKGKDGETGLGLAIARAIVEQSDGSIEAGNSGLGGAKFTLRFPHGN